MFALSYMLRNGLGGGSHALLFTSSKVNGTGLSHLPSTLLGNKLKYSEELMIQTNNYHLQLGTYQPAYAYIP